METGMNAIRTFATVMGVALCALLAAHGSDAEAGSREEVFAACEAQMKTEFGEAEFTFNKLRRAQGNKNFAIGEMTLEDGSKKPIRCNFQRGRVREVMFRNGNATGRVEEGFWTNDRPAGAVFVPPAEEETTGAETAATPTGETGEAETPEDKDEGVRLKTVRVPGAQSQPAAPDQTTAQPPAATDQPAADQSATAQPAQPQDGEAPKAETPEAEADEGPKLVTPVFRKVN